MIRTLLLAALVTATFGCTKQGAVPPPEAAPSEKPAAAVATRPPLPPADELPVLLVAGNLERDLFAFMERIEPGNPGVALLRLGWRTLLSARLGEALALSLDGTAPLVIGIGSEPEENAPMVGVAGLLPGARDAITRGYQLEELGRGMQRMLPSLTTPATNPIGRELQCALMAHAGRDVIACARELDWLPRYALFVADQQRQATRDAALRLQIRGKMLQSPEQVLSAELKSQAARAGYLTTLELLAAMRDLHAELELVDGGIDARLGFSLRPVPDSLAAVLVAPPPTEELLPPPFLELPRDATMAFSSRGVHPDHMAQVADRFWTMVLASLSDNQPDPRWAHLISLARKVMMRGGALVGAYGHDHEGALSVLDEERKKRKPSDKRMDAALADYWVLGLQEEAARVREGIDGLLELDAKSAAARKASGQPPGPRFARMKLKRRDRLPGDAILLRLHRPAPSGGQDEDHFLALGAKGGWVWLCGSPDRKLAIERLRGILAGERNAPQERLLLLRRPGVHDAVAFGFVLPAALVSMDLPRGDDPASRDQAHAQLQALAARGDAGTAPVTMSYAHAEGDKGYRRARLSVYVPDEMLKQAPIETRLPTPAGPPAP